MRAPFRQGFDKIPQCLGIVGCTVFARLDANYTDERFYTYLNDASAKSYTLLNTGFGYRFDSLGMFQQLTVQADVTNLADKKYIGSIGTNGFGVSSPRRRGFDSAR
jgi:outer membrane receptor protein involved in Fe transport